MTATLLTSSTSAIAADEPVIGEAPKLRPWPSDLPDALRDEQGRVLLVPLLAEEVQRRLLELEAYPRRCSAALKALDRVRYAERLGALEIARADCQVDLTKSAAPGAGKWTLWEVAGASGVAALLGVVVGYGVARWAGQ